MNKECNWKPLFPFGVNCDGDQRTIGHFDPELLSREILKSKLVLIRDVTSPSDQDLIEFAESFRNYGFEGVLDWNGEKLFHLKQDLRKDNYIFSNERVPLHWDGAFHVEPSFLSFIVTKRPVKVEKRFSLIRHSF